jgi:hypothetical protein
VRPGVTGAVSSSVAIGFGRERYRWRGYPNKTVDGDKTQSNYTYCMMTLRGETEAWLRVDLRDVYSLKSVKLWYRNDGK